MGLAGTAVPDGGAAGRSDPARRHRSVDALLGSPSAAAGRYDRVAQPAARRSLAGSRLGAPTTQAFAAPPAPASGRPTASSCVHRQPGPEAGTQPQRRSRDRSRLRGWARARRGHRLHQSLRRPDRRGRLVRGVEPLPRPTTSRTRGRAVSSWPSPAAAGSDRNRPLDVSARVGYTFLDTKILAVDQDEDAPPPRSRSGQDLLRRPDASILRRCHPHGRPPGRRSSAPADAAGPLDVEPSFGTFGGLCGRARLSGLERRRVVARLPGRWKSSDGSRTFSIAITRKPSASRRSDAACDRRCARCCKPMTSRSDIGDTPVVHGVSLAVPAGGLVGLIGPNGSGKTTLLRLLAGTRRPSIAGGSCSTARRSRSRRARRSPGAWRSCRRRRTSRSTTPFSKWC